MTATLEPTNIVRALRTSHIREGSRQELLQLACERLRGLGAPFTSVYAYMLAGKELVLEAFAGRETEHTRIPVGQGVCGTAVALGEDQNVPDLRAIRAFGSRSRGCGRRVRLWRRRRGRIARPQRAGHHGRYRCSPRRVST